MPHPYESMVGTTEVSYLALLAILLLRGVPVGVVYAGNNMCHKLPLASFPGSPPAFCHMLYIQLLYCMRQTAGEEPGRLIVEAKLCDMCRS